jgi:HK97 family phage major capsid protein
LDGESRNAPLVRALQFGGRGVSVSVPFNAFSQRVVSVGSTAGALHGESVREELGVLQWSTVANSGATLITGLRENVVLTSEAALPTVRWTAEAGAIADADLTVLGTAASPRRISGQTILSKQLSVQTSQGADQLISRSIARALNAAVDQAALYGLGDGIQPRGILHTPGVNDLSIGGGDWWGHLGATSR